MSDRIVDIHRFQHESVGGSEGVFSVWGGEGDRARFALPIWRAITLAEGERGGLLHLVPGEASVPDAFLVLDLGQDPARTGFPAPPVEILQAREAPALAYIQGGGVVVFLGEHEGEKWFLVVAGAGEDRTLSTRAREDFLFLAGECAGLLFHRGLAREGA